MYEILGLGAAYLLETLCVSLLSDNLWYNCEIRQIEHWYLKEDGSDATETIAVKHASRPAHLAKHQAFFEHKNRQTVTNKSDFEIFTDSIPSQGCYHLLPKR